MKWIKRLLCRHKDYDITGTYMDVQGVHQYKRYIRRCKRCGKEW